MISARIPLLPACLRGRLIDLYCPPSLAESIRAAKSHTNCLARVYLGRTCQQAPRGGRPRRAPSLQFFSIRNYPLHLNQRLVLNAPVNQYAETMAMVLATLRWDILTDSSDIEFVLAAAKPCFR